MEVKFDKMLSHKIIKQHIKETNISELARNVGITPNLMWLYVKAQRKWPVDVWLKTLAFLGSLEVLNDGFSVECKVPKIDHKKLLNLQNAR